MSRIGKMPVSVPKGVTVNVAANNLVSVKGPKGELKQKVDSGITVKVDGETVIIERQTEQKRHRAMHGLYRALIHNMVTGVSEGYKTQLELVGVGFRASEIGRAHV